MDPKGKGMVVNDKEKESCWDHASSPKVLQEETASAEAVCTWWPKVAVHEASELQTDLKVEWPFSP